MRQKIIDAIMPHVLLNIRECCGRRGEKAGAAVHSAVIWQPIRQSISTRHRSRCCRRPGYEIAIVHSHPDATTQPSELDKGQCDATLYPSALS